MQTFIIKNIDTELYLTDFHVGKGTLTNPAKDWTNDVDEAMLFINSPATTLGSLDLIGAAEIIETTDYFAVAIQVGDDWEAYTEYPLSHGGFTRNISDTEWFTADKIEAEVARWKAFGEANNWVKVSSIYADKVPTAL